MQIVKFFTDFISLGDPIYDIIIGAILLAISGSIAYKIGGMSGFEGKSGFILWAITAIIIYALLAVIARAVIWVIAQPWWFWLIIGVVALIIIGVILFIKTKRH